MVPSGLVNKYPQGAASNNSQAASSPMLLSTSSFRTFINAVASKKRLDSRDRLFRRTEVRAVSSGFHEDEFAARDLTMNEFAHAGRRDDVFRALQHQGWD